MLRLFFCSLIAATLLASCKHNKACDGVLCSDEYIIPTFNFKLVEPGTDHDLVYGPYAKISLDSIKIKNADTSLPVKQVIDTVSRSAIMVGRLYGPTTLSTTIQGKVYVDKIIYQMKSVDCCRSAVSGIQLNDSPVSLTQDSKGTYLIPYAL
ncbi:hypothetical protein CLV51_101998 [Chitinophaga niastensis]|uniref:Uncharacterized protein n=1 Tax=Chitinophaga niastensis TaxID=536980 RepID=A0A2P8HTX5_CHINA|nr:hypothetical protein [Chitinophaga niastensis]PSL49663.1 hypothetical protein CLV51_101998 [Chitinophaga niastensis]